MHEMTHPDDELLASLAADEPEAAGDAVLRAHVSGCERCGAIVSDLGALRTALAELPDVAPPRPLRLVPPVAESEPVRLPWFRRLVAPAMAMGGVMVLVGAVGLAGGGLAGGGLAATPVSMGGAEGGQQADRAAERTIWDALFGGAAADAGASPRAAGEDTSGEFGPEPPAASTSAEPAAASPSAAPTPVDDGTATSGDGGWPGWPALPVGLLGAGLVLMAGGLALRYVIIPRAG